MTALSVLCVHGVGHGDADADLVPSWTDAITTNLRRWNPSLDVSVDFLRYDDAFSQDPLDLRTYGEAFTKLLASGIVHGIQDLFSSGARGLTGIPATIQWTAGMIAQWASEDALRSTLRDMVLAKLKTQSYEVVCAHSLGSLICYDAFRRTPSAIANKTFVALGSQIGNPFVRDCFGGRIEPLDTARMWYHLYNHEDHVFTSSLHLQAQQFAEVRTDFDKPNDLLNHDPIWYFNHANTQSRVWLDVSGASQAKVVARQLTAVRDFESVVRPKRRALLIGINEYPNPANRLQGCVNDVFLMSSVLQESGFRPEEIRIVLDDRATTDNILDRLHWLLDNVNGGDERLLFYSGHGAQLPSYDVQGETDHLDECLVPYDFDWTPARAIRDKQFVEFYSQLPYDARFLAIFDCCHAGGLSRDGGPRVRGIDPPDDIRHRDLEWKAALGMWQHRDLDPVVQTKTWSRERRLSYTGNRQATYRLGRAIGLRGLRRKTYKPERTGLRHEGPYMPVIFEACQERELSFEYRDGGASYGAFTFSLVKVLREDRRAGKKPTFNALSQLTADRLLTLGYDQHPCLVGPKKILAKPVPWDRRRARRMATVTRP